MVPGQLGTDGGGMSVTSNDSSTQGSAVTCHACENYNKDYAATNRKWPGLDKPHCTTCHSDSHRACEVCGSCMPDDHRWDRWFCSSTCRVRSKQKREAEALELAIWEAEHPEEAAQKRAEFEALVNALGGPMSPERRASRERRAELKARAERCATCDKPFVDGDTIYRRGGWQRPVLPYCSEHCCGQVDGGHNQDASEGHYFPACACPGGRGDRKWLEPEPCAFCGRLVANDRETADPHKFVREWIHWKEDGTPRVRTFCSEDCRRSVTRVEAKAKRMKARAARPCQACGETFEAGRSDSAYCSSACRQRAYRKRASERSMADPLAAIAPEA